MDNIIWIARSKKDMLKIPEESKVFYRANNFQVKDLKKKLKENNYWLIKSTLSDKWEKGLVEKFFKIKWKRIKKGEKEKREKGNHFRVVKICSHSNKVLGENEEITQSLSPLNFEFSINLPKENESEITYTTKNKPISIIEPKKAL